MFCPKCGKENQNTNKFCKNCGKNLPYISQIRQLSAAQFQYSTPPQTNLLGQVLDGKYRIDAKLGAGGMGDVYRATRLLIGDSVAIKILHAHLAQAANAAERFRREAVTATHLRHRNVVAIYDVGISQANHVPYILMELAEGFSLRQIINQYRVLPLDFVVTAAAQICAALDEAHGLGIIHRDIKPENIIANQTTNGWQIKILDFGIAKLFNQTENNLTQDGNALGTPQYMSPEQCMGEPLDGRSDIYSVGIVLYELLTGVVPFKSPTASAIAIQQLQNPPVPPRSINPNIPPQIEEIILRTLGKKREMRPQTALQLSQEIIKAATVALQSGQTAVPAAPIAAPNVEPEYDAVGEIENVPPSVENVVEPNISEQKTEAFSGRTNLVEPEPEVLDIPAPAETPVKITELETEVFNFFPEEKIRKTEIVPDEFDTGIENEDLTSVFEDAEYILDEILPDEKTEQFNNGVAISIPDEPLPKGAETPLNISEPEIETVLSKREKAEKRIEDLLNKIETSSNLDETVYSIDGEPDVEEVAVQSVPQGSPPIVSQEFRPSVPQESLPSFAPEVRPNFSPEIKSKSANKNLLIFGGIGLFVFFIFFVGIIGFAWFYFGNQSAKDTANVNKTETANEEIDPTKPPSGLVYVPGGDFIMGRDEGDEFSSPAHSVSVKPFFIDLTEVTNEDYKKFVDAENYKPPPDWKNKTFPDGKAKFPVTGVNWDAANAYAKWAGKRLPTEEEWEFAARGTDGRIYPWGNDWNNELANVGNQKRGMVEVGTTEGKSPFGLYDMSGNSWEWTADDAVAYPNGKMLPNDSIEPKIIRGGFYGSLKDQATTTFRRPYGARGEKQGYNNTGLRCIKDIPEK